MTDKEMADEWVKANCDDSLYSFRGKELRCAFIAGLKAGRPKWHRPSEKLPEECTTVLACEFNNEEPSLYRFVTSDQWEWLPRRIAVLNNAEISKWCEIPKYTEE